MEPMSQGPPVRLGEPGLELVIAQAEIQPLAGVPEIEVGGPVVAAGAGLNVPDQVGRLLGVASPDEFVQAVFKHDLVGGVDDVALEGSAGIAHEGGGGCVGVGRGGGVGVGCEGEGSDIRCGGGGGGGGPRTGRGQEDGNDDGKRENLHHRCGFFERYVVLLEGLRVK